MLSALFERLPEVGDLEKPKLVFFFDEAHLLFKDIEKPLLEKIEQGVRLVRSKVEKSPFFQKTIRGIKFYREHLEVIVITQDTSQSAVDEFFGGQSGRLAVGMREGAVNPDAPACSFGSVLQDGVPGRS